MAKNFGQYDDDNPVMAALAKAQQEQEIKNATDILKSAAEIQNKNGENFPQRQNAEDSKEIKNQDSDQKNDESPAEIKKILMNISIRETTKKDWKMFFLEHDLTMTQGIETAVEFLKSEVEKGNIKLSKGGITK